MAYEPKPNHGSLFPNDYKKRDEQPDLTGSLYMDKTDLNDLIQNSKDNLVQIKLSAWKSETRGKKYLSIRVSQQAEKPAATDPWE